MSITFMKWNSPINEKMIFTCWMKCYYYVKSLVRTRHRRFRSTGRVFKSWLNNSRVWEGSNRRMKLWLVVLYLTLVAISFNEWLGLVPRLCKCVIELRWCYWRRCTTRISYPGPLTITVVDSQTGYQCCLPCADDLLTTRLCKGYSN